MAGALPTANGESDIANLKKVVNQYHGGKGPYMVAEFYPGWLSHWGEPFPQVSASEIARQTEAYLQNDVSFNFIWCMEERTLVLPAVPIMTRKGIYSLI